MVFVLGTFYLSSWDMMFALGTFYLSSWDMMFVIMNLWDNVSIKVWTSKRKEAHKTICTTNQARYSKF
jgi:hypothetical protein